MEERSRSSDRGPSPFGLTLFVLALLIGRLKYLAQCCPFRVAWWAVGFPLSAAAIAALRVAAAVPGRSTDGIAVVLLALASLVNAALLLRTLYGIARGELETLTR